MNNDIDKPKISVFSFRLQMNLLEKFRKECENRGLKMARVLRHGIENFLDKM